MEKFDVIHKPSHYAEGRKYEPKDVIRDWGLNFNLGSAVKYISRAGRKDDILQDLNKAKQFIEFEIEAIQDEEFCWNFNESPNFSKKSEEYNDLFIKAQENYFNALLTAEDRAGFITLNEIMDGLGLSRKKKYINLGFDKEFKINYSDGIISMSPTKLI